MAFEGNNIAKFGALFVNTTSASPVKTGKVENFTPTGTVPTGWERLIRLSRENLPSSALDGGDTTNLGTWEEDNTDTTSNEGSHSRTFTGVQTDAATLDKINDLRGKVLGVFMVTQGPNGKRFGEWWPAATFSVTGSLTPSTTGYTSLEFKLTQNTPPTTVNLATIKSGVTPASAAGQWFNGLVFDNDAFGTV